MAIDGLIILESNGRPIIQTNFKSTSPAYPLLHIEAFNNAIADSERSQIDPVLYVHSDQGPSVCCHTECGIGLTLLCPVRGDVDALYIFAFMQLFVETLQDYLGELSGSTLRDHFDIVYQLVEEMLNNGHPLTTERSALRDIVLPPSLLNKILSATGANTHKASTNPFASPIPWRKLGVKHTANEIFFDMSEEMQAIVDKNGSVISSQVWGRIETNSKLSGIPDLLLLFTDNKFLQDCSFHQCVRLQRWLRDKAVSFVPPDGRFVLMDYQYIPVPSSGAINARPLPVPFSLLPTIKIDENGGSFDFVLTSRLSTRVIDRLTVELCLGDSATGANCTVSSGASWGFDPKTRKLRWEILKAPQGASHNLRGSFSCSKPRPEISRAFQISFENNQSTFSGLKIDQLRISHESYKPFKGVRGRSYGQIEWRWR
ncbi:clathrin adaptor, mu subunit [Fomitiporia mediterranea MF3/22]|uniref:clathrin adaptor, mu subunit n=1 Tax=Fomitiporia mediterranea (strain MF3/22) TaxID=694068 RepID=UPI00044091C3|nr:clathrin adaptor, mu subunit [Fomitiporia mediterranea MF3/22]EJD01288.1 clathrin adaptor, mu subunit [Fomitiporia mediterranea MF3/22]